MLKSPVSLTSLVIEVDPVGQVEGPAIADWPKDSRHSTADPDLAPLGLDEFADLPGHNGSDEGHIFVGVALIAVDDADLAAVNIFPAIQSDDAVLDIGDNG